MKIYRYCSFRGEARGLIANVVENSTVPVIETGTGNCHIYVDASADLDMAVSIIDNANAADGRVQCRTGVSEIGPMKRSSPVAATCNLRKAEAEARWRCACR